MELSKGKKLQHKTTGAIGTLVAGPFMRSRNHGIDCIEYIDVLIEKGTRRYTSTWRADSALEVMA